MKYYREEYWFDIPGRRGFVNITTEVEESIKKAPFRRGWY
jgi:hypothetical protein